MDNSSTPLADYFWIAGIENISYGDSSLPSPNFDQTITEDGEGESASKEKDARSTPTASARHSRHNSASRFSKVSQDGTFHLNFSHLEDDGNTLSNRSSATIRLVPPVNSSASQNGNPNGVPEFDFDKALLKFASEREVFLDDLTFSAGAKLQTRPPMVNPRTERIKADEAESGRKSPLKSIKGSIRRKISFRDMNSMRRQPTAPRPASTRQTAASIRTAKRLSNYNSVIPPPEPLNTDPNMHPLKRRFEPTLLDRYPPRDASDELARRGRFPDYVPMFAFPNDIQIVSSDDRPRSTWHGFTMTSEDGSKIYGVAVTVWTALKADVAEEIEQKCEQWRQSHMSNEERELAASLGVRLAAERANLSQLLAQLPLVASGSVARESLDDQISSVEEKIGLMTEMLRPLRHGAASKIDGLTAGESGLWSPRAYGIIGSDASKVSFWKEWLRAIVVPMTDGAVLRVPPSSPRVGRWQPLERYVVNLCTEAFSPISSKTQVELGVRELRLYARNEADNELPGSRSTDLYALFRCLSLDNIVALFEYAMSESRIIFVSQHTAMLHLACHALVSLLYPLKWASVFIPVLPARLLQALDAPCPYIVGIEKRYENIQLPDDDYVLVDLDKDTIDATAQPTRLPRQHRRKLFALLQVAAAHRLRYGVEPGPPPYAIEAFPYDSFSVENQSLFTSTPPKSSLGRWVSQNSATFGEPDLSNPPQPPLFNAFLRSKHEQGRSERPTTPMSTRTSPPASLSPISMNFPPMPTTPVSRSDSGFAAGPTTLREKRSTHFDDRSRRSSSYGLDGRNGGVLHKPSLPVLNGGHNPSLSVSAISIDSQSSYGGPGIGYAPSTYAQSTIAASTVMPQMLVQPVTSTDTTVWVEGHCFNWTPRASTSTMCDVCDERCESDDTFKCAGCGCISHGRCLGVACLVCPIAFDAERVRAAFVRCLASLLYTYRKHLGRPSREQKANGQLYAFDMAGFIRSLPYDQQDYAVMMRDTQAFNEFVHERERSSPSNPQIRLFDEILLAKKARGRPTMGTLSRLSTIRVSHGASLGSHSTPGRLTKVAGYLGDTSDHIWRTASVPFPNAKFPGDYRSVITRVPTKLDPTLMKEPRAIQGVPRAEQGGRRGLVRKQVPSTLNATAASPV
ncbi:dDENN domain-containing protein [Pyricularia oryzae Y34]|uniref:DDENN domain-containing protein n=2 Tax=Pyricularia oryzae TaxID=318829 RepID=A0AA97PI78_PYRO3|nr:dDENN domain-containing protein [Pyricularia oryzae Y34]